MSETVSQTTERRRISRLLIVEDDPSQLRTLKAIMTDEGFDVIAARSAQEALDRIQNVSFGVAVVDLRLPDLTGTQLLERIQALNGRVRVIIHTGYGSFDSARDAVNLGAFAYVEKAGNPDELVRQVHKAFRSHFETYADSLEAAVATRTADLRDANEALRREIEVREQGATDLRESEERFALAARGSSDGIWDWKILSGELYLSPRYKELLGYAPEELPSTYDAWQALVHPDDGRRAAQALNDHLINGKPYDIEYRLRTRDGSFRWYGARGQAMWDDVGRPTRMAGSLTDITERRTAEELLRHRQEELTHISRLSAVGELATNLAHELNQPLAAISNYVNACLELLRARDWSREKLLANMEKAAAQTGRAGDVIRRVRSFVKRRPARRTVLDISTVVAEAIGFVEQRLAEHRIKLRVDIPQTLPEVTADAVLLQQVLLNLIGNGIDAMKDTPLPSRRLSVRVTEQSGDGTISVIVRDTGPGLSDEIGARLFDPFFTTKSGGMGLGLSISRNIVESHGGKLWVVPASGNGVEAGFALPVGQGAVIHESS
jgi:two-component system sensor kinase FixL